VFDLIQAPRAQMISELAYAAGPGKSSTHRKRLIEKKIAQFVEELQSHLKKPNVDPNVAKSIRASLRYLRSLRYVDSTRDVVRILIFIFIFFFLIFLFQVAFTRWAGVQKGDQAIFGFRGTAQVRDLIPDAQLAMNKKNIPRLNEAREFVKKTLQTVKVPNGNLRFYGHSLGGFIAEGVRNGYVGARAITIHAGSPRLFFDKERHVRAWGKYESKLEHLYDKVHKVVEARTTRIVTHGDFVSGKGVKNGKANIYQFGRTKRGLFNPLKNHLLGNLYMLQSKRGMLAANGKEMTRMWSDSVSDMFKGSEKVLKDMNVYKRLRKAMEQSYIRVLQMTSVPPSQLTRTQRVITTVYARGSQAYRTSAYYLRKGWNAASRTVRSHYRKVNYLSMTNKDLLRRRAQMKKELAWKAKMEKSRDLVHSMQKARQAKQAAEGEALLRKQMKAQLAQTEAETLARASAADKEALIKAQKERAKRAARKVKIAEARLKKETKALDKVMKKVNSKGALMSKKEKAAKALASSKETVVKALSSSKAMAVKGLATTKSALSSTKKHAAKVLKVGGKVLGKVLVAANAGHVAVETTKDYIKLQEQLKKTGVVDDQLVRNMVYATPDLILGRGTTEMLVNGTVKAYKKMAAICKEKGGKACRKHLWEGTKSATYAAGRGLKKAGKAIHKGAKKCIGDLKKCGKKIGEVGKAIGSAMKDWGVNTVDFFKDRYKNHKERKAFCNKNAANKKQCKEEDELAELNNARGWKEYRDRHKLARVAYAPVKVIKDGAKALKAGVTKAHQHMKDMHKSMSDAAGAAKKHVTNKLKSGAKAVSDWWDKLTG
jgi:hypothetical protein